jgi:hypothetical protein
MGRTRNVMFPSSKKKRLCRVKGPDVADCDEVVFVDSIGKPHGLIPCSLVTALESLGRAVLMVSRERTVDVDGDSGVAVEAIGESWSMSGLFTHWLMLAVPGIAVLGQVVWVVQC